MSIDSSVVVVVVVAPLALYLSYLEHDKQMILDKKKRVSYEQIVGLDKNDKREARYNCQNVDNPNKRLI